MGRPRVKRLWAGLHRPTALNGHSMQETQPSTSVPSSASWRNRM